MLSPRHPPVLVRPVVLHLRQADLTRPCRQMRRMAEGGDDRMNARCLTLTPGAWLVYDGDLVEVVELDGARVVVRNARTAGFATVKLGRLAAGARPADAPAARDEPSSPGVAWTGLIRSTSPASR